MPDPIITTTPTTSTTPTTITYTVDGTEHKFDLTDPEQVSAMKKLLSKAHGADEAFRKAAETRKSADDERAAAKEALALQEAIGGLNSDDERTQAQALVTLAKHVGMNREQATQFWEAIHGGAETTPDNKQAVTQPVAPRKITYADLPPELVEAAAIIKNAKNRGLDPLQVLTLSAESVESSAETKASGMVREALLRHPDLESLRGKRGSGTIDRLTQKATAALKRLVQSDPNVNLKDALAETVADIVETVRLGVGSVPQPDPSSIFGAGPGPAAPRSVRQPGKPPTLDLAKIGSSDDTRAFIAEQLAADQEAAAAEDDSF